MTEDELKQYREAIAEELRNKVEMLEKVKGMKTQWHGVEVFLKMRIRSLKYALECSLK